MWEQITGDNVLIARETARALGLGTRIRTPEGLPALPASGRMPKDLGATLAPAVLASDGFAQARRLIVQQNCYAASYAASVLFFLMTEDFGLGQDLGAALLHTVQSPISQEIQPLQKGPGPGYLHTNAPICFVPVEALTDQTIAAMFTKDTLPVHLHRTEQLCS